jgi:hypothetical protein
MTGTAFHNGRHKADKRVVLKDRIGVHRTEVGASGNVDPAVQCVRLPGVLLVDDQEVRQLGIGIESFYARGLEDFPIGAIRLSQSEGLYEGLKRVVGRAVIDDDDFEKRVVDGKRRSYRPDDDFFLVVGGDENGNGRRLLEDRNLKGT